MDKPTKKAFHIINTINILKNKKELKNSLDLFKILDIFTPPRLKWLLTIVHKFIDLFKKV